MSNTSNEIVFEADVYLFDSKLEKFEADKFWGKYAAKRGERLGINYHNGELVGRVVFGDPTRPEEDYSWQDHDMPKELVAALELDEDAAHNAPGWIPKALLETIAKDGDLTLTTNHPNVKVHLVPHIRQKNGEFARVLESIS